MKRQIRRVWVVCENTPGFLPESEPAVFRTRQEAEEYARDLARELREAGYRVRGSVRNGYYAERSRSDLGRVVTVEEEVATPELLEGLVLEELGL